MPWPTGRVPKYRKHRASGQAIVTLNGRDHYLGPHGTLASKCEYDRLIAEYLSSGRSPSFGAPQKQLSIVELCAEFLRYAKTYYGVGETSEYHRYRSLIRAVRDLYGRTPACEFGPVQFKAFRQALIARGLSRTYINASARRVTRMFRWGAGEGLVPPEVPQTLSLIAGLRQGKCDARETDRVLPVEDAIVDATLRYLPDVPADMVRLQWLTGMRPAEVCILRPCDLDLQEDVWIYRPPRHKTQHHGKERVIPVGPKAQAILLRYIARDSESPCFQPRDSEAKRRATATSARLTPLSCGNRTGTNRRRCPKKLPGDHYEVAAYRRAIANACDKAFPHPNLAAIVATDLSPEQLSVLRKWRSDHRWAPNQLRHAAATEIRRQFGLEAAQVVLGHSQANVTQVYAERDLARGIEVARAIG